MNEVINKIDNFFGPQLRALAVLLLALWAVSALSSSFSPTTVSITEASATDNLSGYAWSSNIGWISFNCTDETPIPCENSDYGVNLDIDGTSELSGYAWNDNIGWISFNTADVAGCPSGAGTCQPVLNTGTNELEGWAKALGGDQFTGGLEDGWDGWISLSGSVSAGSYWKESYDTPTASISAMTIDTDNSMIYAAGDSGGAIFMYRCSSASGCDEASDWVSIGSPPQAQIHSLFFEDNTNRIYAGTENSSRAYYCVVPNCSSWFESHNKSGGVFALAFDSFRNLMISGNGNGRVYTCSIGSGCNDSSEWDGAGLPGGVVYALVADSANRAVYAGTAFGGSGGVYRCDTNAGNCGSSGDWEPSLIGGGVNIRSLALDSNTGNGVIYAGSEASGQIYRCDTLTGCDENSDWDLSFNAPQERVRSLAFDSGNNVIYAGIDSTGADVNGMLFRCSTLSGCDEDIDWELFYNPTPSNPQEDRFSSLAVDVASGVLYAGTGINGIIYRCFLSTGCGDESSTDTYGVSLSDTGMETENFSGFAWGGDVIGWIQWDPMVSGNPVGVIIDSGPPPDPPTVDLIATPLNIPYPGGDTTLTWTSTDAVSCSNDFSASTATEDLVGITVSLVADRTFNIDCTGLSGMASDSEIVFVLPPPSPDIAITATPPFVPKTGGTTELTWNASNVDSCSVVGPGVNTGTILDEDDGIDDDMIAGSSMTPTITKESIYTLSCNGVGGGGEERATVRIIPTFEEF